MTAAHCVYETTRRGNLVGVARRRDLGARRFAQRLRSGARRQGRSRRGPAAAVLPLGRPPPQPRRRAARARPRAAADSGGARRAAPGRGQVAADRRLRQHLDGRQHAARGAQGRADRRRRPGSCTLVSEAFDPSWLFCGAASTDPAVPGGTSCYGDSGGPAFAYENTVANVVVEGVISYGSRQSCESSRSYLVLVSSERGFIDRALATPARCWGALRDLPPKAKVRAVRRHVNERGALTLRVDDDKSRNSRVAITFHTRGGKRISRAFRNVPTNRWVTFDLGRRSAPPRATSARRGRTRPRSSRTSRARPTSSGDGGARLRSTRKR